MPRYVVPGVPAGVQPSAVMPHWNKYAGSGAQRYKQYLLGSPGTVAIPAPTGNTQISPDAGDKAQMGTARSSDAPDVWYPTQYYQQTLRGNPGPVTPVQIYSDNLMPVPAVDPRGLPARLARPISQRGRAEIPMPRPLPTWNSR
jgi:hypothetical protein